MSCQSQSCVLWHCIRKGEKKHEQSDALSEECLCTWTCCNPFGTFSFYITHCWLIGVCISMDLYFFIHHRWELKPRLTKFSIHILKCFKKQIGCCLFSFIEGSWWKPVHSTKLKTRITATWPRVCFSWGQRSVSRDGGSQKAYLRRCSCWLPTETQDCTGNKMILECSRISGGNMEASCIHRYLGYQAHTHKENYIVDYPYLFALKFSEEHYLENLSREDLTLKGHKGTKWQWKKIQYRLHLKSNYVHFKIRVYVF